MAVGARHLAPATFSLAEVWHHLEVMLVVGVAGSGVRTVLREHEGQGGAGIQSSCFCSRSPAVVGGRVWRLSSAGLGVWSCLVGLRR
jgi:hypothetical protein